MTITIATSLFFSASLSFPEDTGGNYRIKASSFPSSPKIDGALDNPVWSEGTIIEGFTQYEPVEGTKPTEKRSLKRA